MVVETSLIQNNTNASLFDGDGMDARNSNSRYVVSPSRLHTSSSLNSDNPSISTNGMLTLWTSMRERGLFCDITIKLDSGEQFRAHRAIMALSSPFFLALFTQCTGDSKQMDLIHLPTLTFGLMKSILQYCYSRRCHIDENNVEALLAVADRLLILSLKERCCEFLADQLDTENCIGIWRFARIYSCFDLTRRALIYILKNFVKVTTRSIEWLQLCKEDVAEICRNDGVNSKNETEVFDAICRWLFYDKSRRADENAKLDIFRTIRFKILPENFLRHQLKSNYLVSSTLKKLIDSSGLLQDDYSTRHRLPHEMIVAIGGWSGRRPNDTIEVFDVRTGRWCCLDVRLEKGPRAYHASVTLNNEEIYVLGGYNGEEWFNSVCKWNLKTQEKGGWKDISPMNSRRCYVAAVAFDNKIIAFGGYDGHDRMNTAEEYNPQTNQWSYIMHMNQIRSDAGAAVLNGKIYICGGFNGHQCLNTAEVYDPDTKLWTELPRMNCRRSGVSVVNYQGHIYALGGFDGESRVRSVERYNATTASWESMAPMTVARSNFGVCVIDDLLFVVGGYNLGQTLTLVESYNAATNEWTPMEPMGRNRSALSVLIIKDLPNIGKFLRPTKLSYVSSDDGYSTLNESDISSENDEDEEASDSEIE